MEFTVAIDPWLVCALLGVFIALRVWHPITSYIGGRRKRKK